MGEVENGNLADGWQSFMNIVFCRQGERRRMICEMPSPKTGRSDEWDEFGICG
ncbi:MAG TPA: hypothetical protein PK965_11250 [Anaerohalosphaeraceae bacterium]|nr:hypothetical protein [Anaerohalosphaeraceae bacterium]